MNKKLLSHLLLLLSTAIGASPALAHTGVGAVTGFGSGFYHPFGGIDHLLTMLAVGLWAAQMGGRAILIMPGAFVALMISGGVLATSGITFPYVEQGILLSMVTLGVLIAASFRLPLAAGAPLVGLFALFHGHAHGAEMPLAGDVLSYSSGFALATITLHGTGLACGIALQKLNIKNAIRLAGSVIALWGAYLAIA